MLFFPCKGEVERNVVWLEVMEEEEEESSQINSFSVKVSDGNLPSNTKMILGPGFIPPTQLLLFSFSQSSYFKSACPHASSCRAGEKYREGNSIIYLGKRLCHHFHQHLNECTSVTSVEGMHSVAAEKHMQKEKE
ncbi:hypothetical protein DEO72_LG2g5249 [Vigna unguiculata]|uniref:Uncharacterized protein n=1 Tax=Vigna unguiculata TaxID=3917 RepID=A0A4D6L8P4_VIGUN|nr:hypothetical protein DEO72_LG2g5249 [Vigna unguiculata]